MKVNATGVIVEVPSCGGTDVEPEGQSVTATKNDFVDLFSQVVVL